jgi:hypothetical protein
MNNQGVGKTSGKCSSPYLGYLFSLSCLKFGMHTLFFKKHTSLLASCTVSFISLPGNNDLIDNNHTAVTLHTVNSPFGNFEPMIRILFTTMYLNTTFPFFSCCFFEMAKQITLGLIG